MKLIIKIALLFIVTDACGQKLDRTVELRRQIYGSLDERNFKDSLSNYDFSLLWTQTRNSSVYGFVGTNYQRLRIKIISAKKDIKHPDTYNIFGKSMVRNNISEIRGTIKIDSIRIYKKMHWGADDHFKNKGIKMQGILVAKYHFAQDSAEIRLGSFDGNLISSWFIDKDDLLNYDNIEIEFDSYCNNQFVGTWTNPNKKGKVICNWGDFRAPFCGDLDEGAGEFSPYDTYLKYGWQTVRDAYFSETPDSAARKEEERQWWKK